MTWLYLTVPLWFMTPEQALLKIKNSILKPSRHDRWSLRLWKRWRKNYKKNFVGLRGMRVPEYEDILSQDFDCLFWYATQIVRGPLPEKLHNIMISHGIINPNDQYVKIYFEMIEGQNLNSPD